MGDRGRHRRFKRPQSTIRTFFDFILHKIDLFAKPITLTYAQDPKFKSNIGGICTIVVGLILFALAISELITLINKSNTTYSSIFNTQDILKDSTLYKIGSDSSFNFAFSFFLQVHIEKQINFILAKHAFQYPESIIFSGFKSLWTIPMW